MTGWGCESSRFPQRDQLPGTRAGWGVWADGSTRVGSMLGGHVFPRSAPPDGSAPGVGERSCGDVQKVPVGTRPRSCCPQALQCPQGWANAAVPPGKRPVLGADKEPFEVSGDMSQGLAVPCAEGQGPGPLSLNRWLYPLCSVLAGAPGGFAGGLASTPHRLGSWPPPQLRTPPVCPVRGSVGTSAGLLGPGGRPPECIWLEPMFPVPLAGGQLDLLAEPNLGVWLSKHSRSLPSPKSRPGNAGERATSRSSLPVSGNRWVWKYPVVSTRG